MTSSVPRSSSETSVLLPSTSTRRLRPRRRVKSDDSLLSSGPGPAGRASTGPPGTGSSPDLDSRLASPATPRTGSTLPTSVRLLPRRGEPLIRLRPKYPSGPGNGYPSPEAQAATILALAGASTLGSPRSLEEVDAAAAQAANGTSVDQRRDEETVPRGVLAHIRALLPSPDATPPSPPKPSPRRRLSLPSFQEPAGLHCPGRNELRANQRRASDPGLPALREIMRRRIFAGPVTATSSSTHTDLEGPHQSAEHTDDVNHEVSSADTEGALMITTRRRGKLRRSPKIEPVLEVDESHDALPSWARDFDDFLNGREGEDDEDTVQLDVSEHGSDASSTQQEKADSFSEILDAASK